MSRVLQKFLHARVRSTLPDPPEVIEEPLLQLGQEQSDGRLSVHADDALARSQRRVTDILVLISQGLQGATKTRGDKDRLGEREDGQMNRGIKRKM